MSEQGPDPDLALVLEWSRDRGFLGPGPVSAHIDHARSFLAAVGPDFAGRGVDLGSGGGLPGLALASWLPASRWVLVDANLRRIDFLTLVTARLGLAARVEVHHARAEAFARDPLVRGGADVVVARSFGPPAVVAECAAPLLRVGGRLVVSEPPEEADGRWPTAGLRELGLATRSLGPVAGHRLAQMIQEAPVADRYPRRVGVPERAPLF